jgi:predicted ATPase
MLLGTLSAQNFRNLRGEIHCGKNLNIIFGENGQGKTNWLEAIYLLATTKSFKTARLQEAIKFDADLAIVRGAVERGAEISRVLQVALQGNTKNLSVNNKTKRSKIFRTAARRSFQFGRTRNRARHTRSPPQISRRRHRFDLPAVRSNFNRLQPRHSTEKLVAAIGAGKRIFNRKNL